MSVKSIIVYLAPVKLLWSAWLLIDKDIRNGRY
jgi:hypothetical protein